MNNFEIICKSPLIIQAKNPDIPSLDELRGLEIDTLYINGCKNITNLSILENHIRKISLKCTSAVNFYPLRRCEEVDIAGSSVINLEGLEHIRKLNISNCTFLRSLPDFSSLEEINLNSCVRIEKLFPISRAKKVNIGWLDTKDVSFLSSVEELDMRKCFRVKDLNFPNIKKLNINECILVENVNNVNREIEELDISETNISSLSFSNLIKLNCANCKKLLSLPSGLRVSELDVSGCKIVNLNEIVGLKKLVMYRCPKLNIEKFKKDLLILEYSENADISNLSEDCVVITYVKLPRLYL